MEKPITRTTFLHDIGLFVEKYLSASSTVLKKKAFRSVFYVETGISSPKINAPVMASF
jgi:hypothetical protein